jgi:hypothetical protein
MVFDLTEESFIMYAMKHYDNPYCKGMAEFLDDIKRFKYIKRLLGKYHSDKGLKERLIINHIIVINNLFGVEAATKMLFFKTEERFWPQLKTFLVFLNYMPEKVVISSTQIILDADIPIDSTIANVLRKV